MKSVRVQCCTSGKPTEDTHDAEHGGYVPSELVALQATLCMRLHDNTCPFIHAAAAAAAAQHWCTLTVLVLHSNYLTSDTLTFLFGSVIGLSKEKPSEFY